MTALKRKKAARKKPHSKPVPAVKAPLPIERLAVRQLPAFWPVSRWPLDVPPYQQSKVKRFVKTFENELIHFTAIARNGHSRDINAHGFLLFWKSNAARVKNYDIHSKTVEAKT